MGLFDWVGEHLHDKAMHAAYWNHTRRLRARLAEETKYLKAEEQQRGVLLVPELPEPFEADYVIPDSFMLLDHWDENFSVEQFIQERGGAIKDWKDPNTGLGASAFINEAAAKHKIDPRLLLVSLQREKSIVRRPQLPAKVMDWAWGVGAYDGKRKWDTKYKGFPIQVDKAAETYANRRRGFVEGEALQVDFDTKVVTPRNAATYALYVYTPHIHAAKLTHVIWKGFFGV